MKAFFKYYKEVFVLALTHALDLVQALIFLAFLAVPLLKQSADFFAISLPVFPDTSTATFALWALLGTLSVRLILSPFWLNQRQKNIRNGDAKAKVLDTVHAHDARLLRKWRSLITSEARSFLRKQSFGAFVQRDRLRPFQIMAEDWVGMNYEFQNEAMQKLFASILECNRNFVNLTCRRLHTTLRVPFLLTAKTDLDVNGELLDTTKQAIKDMDCEAQRLYDLMEDFERLALNIFPKI